MKKSQLTRPWITVLVAFVLSVIIVLLCACSPSADIDNSKSQITASSSDTQDVKDTETPKGTEYPLISALYSFVNYRSQSIDVPINEIVVGPQLKRLLKSFEGKEVYFDFIVLFGKKTIPQDMQKFANDIGAEQLKEIHINGLHYYYGFVGTADSVEKLLQSEYEGCYIDINFKYEEIIRPDGYNEKITDSVVLMLEKISDTDEIEVVVGAAADRADGYVYLCGHRTTVSSKFASMTGFNALKPYPNAVLSLSEVNTLTEKYVSNIIKRNNISNEKIVESNVRVGVHHITEEQYNDILVSRPKDVENIICAGFTAKLKKSEIIFLANDPDIKIIQNDTVIGKYVKENT